METRVESKSKPTDTLDQSKRRRGRQSRSSSSLAALVVGLILLALVFGAVAYGFI